MNIQEFDILLSIADKKHMTQRELASACGYSLGTVNQSLQNLISNAYLAADGELTSKAQKLLKRNKPKRAIIMAAGMGMRMEPINTKLPKGLLQIKGQRIIERQIEYLHAVGIYEIYVVVGFKKERFEYLIDDFGVELIVNEEYAVKNNLHTLALAQAYLNCAYVIPSDLWCEENPFRKRELYSWYMVSDEKCKVSDVRMNRKLELVPVSAKEQGDRMVGISYIAADDADRIRQRIIQMDALARYDGVFWEEALYDEKRRMIVTGRRISADRITEINTYDQLRELDNEFFQQKCSVSDTITGILGVDSSSIRDITSLKQSTTNQSFSFYCNDKQYVLRIPGEEMEKLVNRAGEETAYRMLKGKGICEDVVYLNPENGYKISQYLEHTRVCDPRNWEDVDKCMGKLRQMHALNLQIPQTFDIFEKINYYESLWEGIPSEYQGYAQTKENVMSLRGFVEQNISQWTLCHNDAVPNNFIFAEDDQGKEKIYMIDWEYAGMQDPHVDIAMFGVYASYNKEQMDRLIDGYFPEGCPEKTRTKIYCYVAVCGMLWSNWCEYKRNLGMEFGEYALRQYRYAKEYYRIAMSKIGE